VFTQSTRTLDSFKKEAVADVEQMKDFSAQMVDQVFSYGELGFQEFETSRYLIDTLKKNGFQIKEGISGIATAWLATWGSGKPVIALGSDIDGIPKASQKPGVAYHDPIIEGAPGHGEGHNSGVPLNITAALAVKKIMEREKLPGTLMLWPGVAEELLGRRLTLFETVTSKTWTSVSSCMLVTISMSATGQPTAADLSPSNTRFVAKRRMPLQLRGAAEARWMQSS